MYLLISHLGVFLITDLLPPYAYLFRYVTVYLPAFIHLSIRFMMYQLCLHSFVYVFTCLFTYLNILLLIRLFYYFIKYLIAFFNFQLENV